MLLIKMRILNILIKDIKIESLNNFNEENRINNVKFLSENKEIDRNNYQKLNKLKIENSLIKLRSADLKLGNNYKYGYSNNVYGFIDYFYNIVSSPRPFGMG